MNTELIIDINGQPAKTYMQAGFFDHKDIFYPMHKHLFVEMHIFLSGSAVLKYGEECISLQEGDVLVVPANMLHEYQCVTKDSKRITFLIESDSECESFHRITLPSQFLALLCKEIQNYVLSGKNGKLKALLSYICSDFFTAKSTKPIPPITNRELIVEEFFFKNYNANVTVDDLARELMLSRKQTEREVKRITGNTFVGELTKRRISAAVILSQTTDLPLTKISSLVGYATYCGFYKAYKRVTDRLQDEKK